MTNMVYRISINNEDAFYFYDSLTYNYDEFGVYSDNETEAYEIYNQAKQSFPNDKVTLYYETEDYDSHNPDHKQIIL